MTANRRIFPYDLRSCEPAPFRASSKPSPSPSSSPTQTTFKCSMLTSLPVEPTSSCGTNNRIGPYKSPSTSNASQGPAQSPALRREVDLPHPLFRVSDRLKVRFVKEARPRYVCPSRNWPSLSSFHSCQVPLRCVVCWLDEPLRASTP